MSQSSDTCLKNKDVKIRVHHLSHYFVRLTYDSGRRHSINLHFSIKNYHDVPVSPSCLLTTKLSAAIFPDKLIRNNICCCGLTKEIVEPISNRNEFEAMFLKLEKHVDMILKIYVEMKHSKKIMDDRMKRRGYIRILKRSRSLEEQELIRIVKEILKI
jgi:hypothetical protein